MYEWVTQIIGLTNNWINEKLDFMYEWITQIIGLTNNWISCMNGLHK
jgi:hypothetical protein